MIFTRNPELGKCKTRLAATVGDQVALDIYTFLLEHTVQITKDLNVTKEVHYSQNKNDNDLWEAAIYNKMEQSGSDLGKRMEYAFAAGFEKGYQNIIIIGSDMYDLNQIDLEHAFTTLKTHDYVIGPAEDGGYYLFGMKSLNSQVFKNKIWGTDSVLKDTLEDLKKENIKLLEVRNDIDYYEDIKDIAAFQKFLD
ncbi:glycosyltransferase [Aquimarina aggregata]|uniref:Glycosyltransferase n=2 Tax=Aquimarina aggregata TaxID=1642818 RepID=A0A162FC42_9FLAO|nr:TIGR04282 family arsenosugar biosynthesis glycosyltransferase [Aquimarina aggregata]KZS41036.1 glycosyltransferase [Aquimarina aggregata]